MDPLLRCSSSVRMIYILVWRYIYTAIIRYLISNNGIPNFSSLKPHGHITSICTSIGNMYVINLSGSVIMNVAVLSFIIFKYYRNILMIDLIHEYSDDVKELTTTMNLRIFNLKNMGSVCVNGWTPAKSRITRFWSFTIQSRLLW